MIACHTRLDRRLEIVLLILVLALAAFLRLYRLELIDVRFDEASAPQLALGIARGVLLPVAPFSGSVANHPPVYLYVLALPYLFTRDFMAVAAYRALLDVLAIGLCWWLCRRHFGLGVAFVACVLFAVAPWAVHYARKTWLAPLPLFQVMLLSGLLEVLNKRNGWGWAVAGWGIALCVGSHLAAIYLVPVLLIGLALAWRTVKPLPVLVGLVPCALLIVAYVGFDATQQFANVRGLLGATGGAEADARISADALNFTLWISGGAHLSDLTGPAFAAWQAQVSNWLNAIDSVQIAWLCISVVILGIAILQADSQRKVYVLLLAWMALPLLLQLRHTRPLQLHYFTILFPVPFVVMALGLAKVSASSQRVGWRILAAVALLVIAGWQTFTTLRFANFVETHVTSPGGYGPPIKQALAVAQMARDAVRSGRAPDVIVVAPGGDPSVDELATVFDALLADVPHRFVNGDAGLILRQEHAQYIFVDGTTRAFETLKANTTDLQASVMPASNNNTRAYTYAFAPRASLDTLRPTSALWANGVGLLGDRVQIDDKLRITLALKVFRAAESAVNYHWFAHVYAGQIRIAQQDSGGIHPRNWRADDILLLWFDVPVAQNSRPDSVRVGTYLYPQIQNVMVLDSAGNPIDDYIRLNIDKNIGEARDSERFAFRIRWANASLLQARSRG